jgi:transposase
LVPPPDNDGHDCGWKVFAKAQEAKIAELTGQLQELRRVVFGKKSEKLKSKLPPAVKPPRDPNSSKTKREAAKALWAAHLQTEIKGVPVPPEQCTCPKCGCTELRRVGNGKPSTVYSYVQPHFRKIVYQRETLSCRCGHIVTAPAPDRVGEKTRYSPSFIAHLIVSKCNDSIPQYRLEKAYRNIGIPMSRSTMCDLLHRSADELRPLYDAALRLVPQAPDAHADETTIRQLGLKGKAYLWDFVTPDLVVYRYAPSRSGDTPLQVLGDSQGRLVVDQYTGYNIVTKPGRRTRAGCLAHARRKLFEQRQYVETKEALELIREIYVVEHEAKVAGIVGTPEHLALRQTRSRLLFARLLCWAHRHRHAFEPRSKMGRAVNYIVKNFRALGCFLRYASIPPDNNIAESPLRRVALGRANFLFVGNEDSGHDFAVLYTLVASCEKHELNPITYLNDVLTRVQSHPASRILELLPHRWKPPNTPASD